MTEQTNNFDYLQSFINEMKESSSGNYKIETIKKHSDSEFLQKIFNYTYNPYNKIDSNGNRNTNLNSNANANNSLINETIDREKVLMENTTLKADNLIYREDIRLYTELNKNFENELLVERKRNLEITQDNESLHKELLQKDFEIERLKDAITKLKLFENPGVEAFMESKYAKDNKIKELEYEIKNLLKEKGEMQVENRYLDEKAKEYKNTINEVDFNRNRESENIKVLESKIEKLSNELEFISRENRNMRITDEKYRSELNIVKQHKEKFENKYIKKKEEIQGLKIKLSELDGIINQIKKEEEFKLFDNKKKDDEKRKKIDKKQKVISEMQNRILDYKRDIQKQRILNNRDNVMG